MTDSSPSKRTARLDELAPLQRGLLYKQLEEDLRRRILDGKLVPGTRLPSENQLCELHGISRITVRKALERLAADGLIRREPGRGTFVSDPHQSSTRPDQIPLIGFVSIGDITPFSLELLSGIEEGARREGFMVLFTSSNYDPERESEFIYKLVDRGVAGLVILPTFDKTQGLETLVSSGFPTVLLDRYFENLPLDCVTSDNELGGYQAARHLLELGHVRIAFVGRLPISSSQSRWRGYNKALAEWGLRADVSLTAAFAEPPHDEATTLTSGLPQDSSTFGLVKELIERQKPTGLICFSEYFSIMAVAAIRDIGLEIGRDISVVGFDRDARRFVPDTPLTIVTQVPFQMGATAIQLLVTRMRSDSGLPPRHVRLPTQLVVRRSTRRYRVESNEKGI